MERLTSEQRIDFDSPTPDPLLHIDYVWTKGPGRMFGVMVCKRADSGGSLAFDGDVGEDSGELIVLKAFSGQMTNYWHVPGWVGPVATIINTTPLYQHYRTLTEAHSARLTSLDLALQQHQQQHQHQTSPVVHGQKQHNGHKQRRQERAPRGAARSETQQTETQAFLERQRRLLRARRKALSHELLARIQDSYRVRNFDGRELRLLQVYDDAVHRRSDARHWRDHCGGSEDCGGGGDDGPCPQGQGAPAASHLFARALAFPAGTGDCCAPKLLWAAVQRGLTPLGMVEFWYGSPPNTATAQGRRGDGAAAAAAGGATSLWVHGEMYGMCDKCERILGSMLCGAPSAGGGASDCADTVDTVGKGNGS